MKAISYPEQDESVKIQDYEGPLTIFVKETTISIDNPSLGGFHDV